MKKLLTLEEAAILIDGGCPEGYVLEEMHPGAMTDDEKNELCLDQLDERDRASE